MKEAIAKYLEYLKTKNSSPHTVSNYGKDLGQFLEFLSPPDSVPPALRAVNHGMIREFVSHLHDHGLEKSSIARKRGALEGESRAPRADAKTAEAHPFGAFRGRDERFPQPTRGNGAVP